MDLYPFMDGGAQEKGLRAGTENVAAIAGMAVALKNNCENIEVNRKHLFSLENDLLDIGFDELAALNLPFNWTYIPIKYPQPVDFLILSKTQIQ